MTAEEPRALPSRSGTSGRIVIVGLVALLLGCLLGALGVAWLHPAPDTSAIANATRAPLVTAPVELRAARQIASVQGKLSPPSTAAIAVTVSGSGVSTGQPSGTAQSAGTPDAGSALPQAALPQVVRQVVSKQVRAVGDTLSPGSLIAEVSGRPVFAFPATAPLYRDLVEGLSGADVLALQNVLVERGFLKSRPDGQFGSPTQAALATLYKTAGYPMPTVSTGALGLPLSETAQLPQAGVRIIAACPVGSEPTKDVPLVTVETHAAAITARVDVLQAPSFKVGAQVHLQVGTANPIPTEVQSVGTFQASSEAGTPAGYDITVSVPSGVTIESGQPITVREVGEPSKAPTVPMTTIRRDDSAGTYVLVVDATATPAQRRVAVTVTTQCDGYAILASDDDLPVGALVVVSGG